MVRWWVFRERLTHSTRIPCGSSPVRIRTGPNIDTVRAGNTGSEKERKGACRLRPYHLDRTFPPEITGLALWQVLIRRREIVLTAKTFLRSKFLRGKNISLLEIYSMMNGPLYWSDSRAHHLEKLKGWWNFAAKWICCRGRKFLREATCYSRFGDDYFFRELGDALGANCPWHNQSRTNVVYLIWISREHHQD